MDFDRKKEVFLLDEKDRAVLDVGEDRAVWPLEDVDHLLDNLKVAENLAEAIDPSASYGGVQRNQLIAEQTFKLSALHNIRMNIAPHVSLQDGDFDSLLNSDD